MDRAVPEKWEINLITVVMFFKIADSQRSTAKTQGLNND
jgi:hypothetical protein